MSIRTSLALSLVFTGLVACTSSTEADPTTNDGPVAESEAALELVACRAGDSRVACIDGWASDGQRCSTSRDCADGTVCRGADARVGGGHCFYVKRDEPTRDAPAACPRGSIAGYVLCAPGFENKVVSRDPHCEVCEAGSDVARRCFAAGLTADRCRAILNDHRDDGVTISDRCRNAGLTPTQCRRLVSDNPDRDDSPIRGDLNGDRKVDETDERLLTDARGPVRDTATRADINGDRVVDDADLRILRDNRGDYR